MFGYALPMIRPRSAFGACIAGRLAQCMALASLLTAPAVRAEPYVPATDSVAVESRYDGPSPELEALRVEARALALRPDDAVAAARVARGYLRLGRRDGDSRLVGYAQAALRPWWEQPDPPGELLFLRASLRQTLHQFAPALTDLQAYLARPDLSAAERAQALLTRSTVLGVLGRSRESRQDCEALPSALDRVTRLLCVAQSDALGSGARRTLKVLELYFHQGGFGTDREIRRWGDLILGDLAARAAQPDLADMAFQEALREDAGDSYSLAAYADFLLDQQRAAEVRGLLADRLQVDALLLRHAIALQRLGDPQSRAEVKLLAARYGAARERGDHSHKREEARFQLVLRSDAAQAVRLALDNWQVQREPADLRILAESAEAAGDRGALQTVRDWLRRTGLIDLASPTLRGMQPRA